MLTTMSRTGRLSLRFGVVFAMGMGLLGLALYIFATVEIRGRVDAALRQDRDILLAQHGTGISRKLLKTKIADLENRHPASSRGHVLFDAQHQMIYGHLRMSDPGTGIHAIRYGDIGNPRVRHGRALGVDLANGDRLVVYAHSEMLENLGQVLLPLILALMVSSAIGGLIVTYLLGREIGKRVSRIIHTADTIAEGNLAQGDLAHRIPLDRLDGVFAQQARSLNRMLDRIEILMRSQRHFSANLAHDLRTPLTRLHSLLDAAGHRVRRAQDKDLVEEARRECRSIIAIFDALLRLSEIEAGSQPSAMEAIGMRTLVEDVAETMEPVLSDRGRRLCVGRLDDVLIHGDHELVAQLLVNMLENVALHTPVGTCATLSLVRRDAHGDAILTVADDGPGLDAREMARIIKPFERGRATGEVRGSGLGLAIAQAIVRFHHGTLELADNAPGLAARIRFPIAAAAILAHEEVEGRVRLPER